MQEPNLERSFLCGSIGSRWIREVLVQKESGCEKGTEDGNESNLHSRQKGASVQVLLSCQVTLREVQTVVIVTICEIVDVVSDHAVLAIVDGSRGGSLACASEVSLQSRSSRVTQRQNVSVVGPSIAEALL